MKRCFVTVAEDAKEADSKFFDWLDTVDNVCVIDANNIKGYNFSHKQLSRMCRTYWFYEVVI